MLRIALLSYDFAEYVVHLANGLSQHAQVTLFLARENWDESLAVAVDAVDLRLFDKPRLRDPLRQMRLTASLVRQLRALKPDVLHFQYRHLWFNLALPLLRDIPLVVTIHDAAHHPGDFRSKFTPQWVSQIGYRQAARLITHAEVIKQQAVDGLGLPADKIAVLPTMQRGMTVPRPTDVQTEPQTVLFFGRIWPYKGLDYLIAAEPMIAADFPDFKVIIAGEGESLDRYRAQMSDPDRYEIHDRWVDNHERAVLFERATFVVLPYIEASQSGVIPVAYCHETPVVATHVGGLPELVIDGETGLLVPPKSAEALAQAICTLLANPERRAQMGRNGQAKLRRDHSPAAIAEKSLAVYREACGQ